MKNNIITNIQEFLKYNDLLGIDSFEKFTKRPALVNDEIIIDIEDNGVIATISYNNEDYEKVIYIARIDSFIKGNGAKFINKLIDFTKYNNFDGIMLNPENDKLIKYYENFGFVYEDGLMFLWF